MKRKKNTKKRLKKRKILRKLLLFAIIIILIYLFAFKTDFFNIINIEVVGNERMSYDKVVKASMCVKGENILNIDIEEGEENLIRLPYVKIANIKRELPRKIVIEIEERKEVAIISHLGSFIYIDEEGYILDVKEKKESNSLPQIFGLEQIPLDAGVNIYEILNIENMEDFITYSSSLNLLHSMKFINFSDDKNIKIELNNETKVAFGSLNNVKYKLSFLYEILKDINKKNIKAKQILFNKGDNPIIVTDS